MSTREPNAQASATDQSTHETGGQASVTGERTQSSVAGGWDRATDQSKLPAEVPSPKQVDVPPTLRQEIEGHMALYPDPTSAALPALAAAQRVHGWCSPQAIEQVACVMQVTPASLAAVATFYDMLETSPVGRHSVYVCTNISCSLRGADTLYEAMRQAAAGGVGVVPDINVRPFECLGACDIAPMASVEGVYVGPLDLDDVQPLLDDVRAGRPVLPDKQLARMLVADPQANSQQYPSHAVQTIASGQGQAADSIATDTSPTATDSGEGRS